MVRKTDAKILLLREYFKRSFYNYFKYFWNLVETSQFEDNYHIKLICDTLQRRYRNYQCDDGKHYVNDIHQYDILLNLPPGSSKSLMVSVFFPTWVWLQNPEIKFITASYSHKVAEELSSKSLKILTNQKYLDLVIFKITSFAVGNIKNSYGGQRFVTSTSGTITGIHADILLLDDLNGPSSIYSVIDRENAKSFVNEILPSRKTSIRRSYSVYVQQRFHNDDVSGVILSQPKQLKHISISAVNEKGESFFEKRFPLKFLEQMKEQLGSISFMAQYQQITQDEAGGIIKRDWIQEIEGDSSKRLTYFVDSAYGGKNADDNAIIGVYKNMNNIIIQSCEINKLEFPQLLTFLKSHIPAGSKIYIEGKASGKSIIQTLKQQTSFLITETQPKAGKEERKRAISPYFESGKIFINKYIKNKQKILDQLIFDNGKNDDISDVIVMAAEELLKKNNLTILR